MKNYIIAITITMMAASPVRADERSGHQLKALLNANQRIQHLEKDVARIKHALVLSGQAKSKAEGEFVEIKKRVSALESRMPPVVPIGSYGTGETSIVPLESVTFTPLNITSEVKDGEQFFNQLSPSTECRTPYSLSLDMSDGKSWIRVPGVVNQSWLNSDLIWRGDVLDGRGHVELSH